MAEKYKVTLSDGRTFAVTTEGGPPSESDVMAYLGGGAQPKAPVGELPGSTARLRAANPGATEPAPPQELGPQVAQGAVNAIKGFGEFLNPSGLLPQNYGEAALGLANPAAYIGKKGFVDPFRQLIEKAKSEPSTLGKVGYGAAAALPVFGPAAASIGEDVGTGEIGKAVGKAGALALPLAIRGAVTSDAGVAARGAIADQAPRAVNSVLGSKVAREILIGKNPGQAVLDEGLLSGKALMTKGSLKEKIAARSEEIGNEVKAKIANSPARVFGKDANGNPIPIKDAIAELFDKRIEEAGTSGAESALKSEKEFWLKKVEKYAGEDGAIPIQDSWKLKKMAGNSTNFNFQGEVEGAKNQVLSDVFHLFQRGMNEAEPGLATLNDRWSNMIGAEKALANTIAKDQGKAILSLRSAAAVMGATPARLGLAKALNAARPAVDPLAQMRADLQAVLRGQR